MDNTINFWQILWYIIFFSFSFMVCNKFCHESSCYCIAEGRKNKRFHFVVTHKYQQNLKYYLFQGVSLTDTMINEEYQSQSSILFAKTAIGDTLIKNENDYPIKLLKKDGVYLFIYECEGTEYTRKGLRHAENDSGFTYEPRIINEDK
jgi:hypothetical protein